MLYLETGDGWLSGQIHTPTPTAVARARTSVSTEQKDVGPHSRSGRFHEEKSLLPLPEVEPRTVQFSPAPM